MQKSNGTMENRSLHFLKKTAFLSMIVFAAAGPIACSVLPDETGSIASTPSPKKTVIATRVAPVNKVYAYSAPVKLESQAVGIRAVSYMGSGPYICSPSGFGQKSRCFVRQSI